MPYSTSLHALQVRVKFLVISAKSSDSTNQSEKRCPFGSPSVAPHFVQVFGSVQVASAQLCFMQQPQSETITASAANSAVIFFISQYILPMV